jgi:uncharacterized protein YukE
MGSVIADPDKLKQLSNQFKGAAEQCEQIAKQLQRSLDNAGWDDRERQKFEDSLKQSLRALNRLADQFRSQYPAELQRKIAALEAFRS